MLAKRFSGMVRFVARAAVLSGGMSVGGTVALYAAPPEKVESLPAPADKNWVIEIRPADFSAAATGVPGRAANVAGPEAPGAAASGPAVPVMTYQQAYNAVPFN